MDGREGERYRNEEERNVASLVLAFRLSTPYSLLTCADSTSLDRYGDYLSARINDRRDGGVFSTLNRVWVFVGTNSLRQLKSLASCQVPIAASSASILTCTLEYENDRQGRPRG